MIINYDDIVNILWAAIILDDNVLILRYYVILEKGAINYILGNDF